MRINKIQLAGLAVVLAGVTAGGAAAEDVTIGTATTTPLTTSDPNPAAAPVEAGDITISSGGSIAITAGQTAITVDSSNDVTNDGTISSNNADNVTGILIEGGNSGTITNTRTISLIEDHTMEDDDDDGDFDDPFAIGTNRHGILLQAGPTFTGDIISTGSISIEGNNSSAITLDALLTGDLTTGGSITVIGDNSVGVAINEGVTGDVIARANMMIRGENSTGLEVNGAIGGELIINGQWSVTGFHSTNRPLDTSDLDADDLELGGPAIAIRDSVAGGVTIDGVGVEDDEDDDGDGETEEEGDTNDDLSAAITSYGSGEALLVEADGSNITLGANVAGFGLHVQGSLSGLGVYDGIDATAIRLEGVGGSTVQVDGGIAIDGVVTATAAEADATAIVLGQNVSTPELLVRRTVTSIVGSESAGDTAQALHVQAGANLPAFSNTGSMLARVFGEEGDAVVITDESNTLATINNTGSIVADIIATDDDPTDDIPPPAITGRTIAFDLSASTIDVTLTQSADVPFNDEDSTDDDAEVRPAVQIIGDILFGSGNDRIDLLEGRIVGDVEFGAGANDLLFIDNGAIFQGRLTDSDGQLTINVTDGTLRHGGGTTNFTDGTFGSDAILGITISEAPGESTFLHASGQISFAAGAEIFAVVPIGLPDSGTYTFLTADGGLIGADNVTGALTSEGTPFLYNVEIDVVDGDPNSLETNYIIKTAGELGLTANQGAAFNPILEALRQSDLAAAAFAGIDNESDFFDAYGDLMPSYASASTELAATAIQQAQSATSNRMAYTRLHGLDEVSVWVQEIAYGLNREPITPNGQEFRGTGFGLAMGIDGPLDNGAMFGLSASFLASEAEEPAREEGEISSWFGQGNAYLGTAMGPVDLDFVVGAGFGQMRSERFIDLGAMSAITEAEWWAYEGHGAARASLPLSLGESITITPQAALTYVILSEEGYTEEGGGAAFDLEADNATSQRLWADVGVEISGRWQLRSGGILAPRLYAGYRANAIDEEAERTFRFVSGTSEFTLQDEPLGDGGPLVGIGLDATNGYSTISIGYEGEFGDQVERHSLNAAIRFRF